MGNRELRYNGCGQALTYRNQGAYGYTLATHAEKYLVDPALRYYPVDWSDSTITSPTEPYDKSVTVLRSAIASVGAMIITPGPAGNELVNISDVSGITYLAPVVQSGSANSEKSWMQWSSTPYGDQYLVGYRIWCEDNIGKIRVRAGIMNESYYIPSVANYPRYAEFTPGVSSTSESVTWADQRNYELGPLAIQVNYDGGHIFNLIQSPNNHTGYYGGQGSAIGGIINYDAYLYRNIIPVLSIIDGRYCNSGETFTTQGGGSFCYDNSRPYPSPIYGYGCNKGYSAYSYTEYCYTECGYASYCARPVLNEIINW